MVRVVITGVGVVSPIGCGVNEFWSNVTAGRSGIGPISLFDASAFPVRIAGEVKDFQLEPFMEEFPNLRNCRDRKVFFALEAARQATADSRLSFTDLRNGLLHIGVGLEIFSLEDLTPYARLINSGHSIISLLMDNQSWNAHPFDSFDEAQDRCAQDKPGRGTGASTELSRMSLKAEPRMLQTPLDYASRVLGDRYGLLAGRYTNCSACAAGAQAIGEAWQMLREGLAEIALAGATDSMINPLGVGGFSLLRVLSNENEKPQRACRPFDAFRKGTVLGEGASFAVLETLDRALARKAKIYAELVGYASSMDAFRVSDPDNTGRGAVQCMNKALKAAQLSPGDIDCVNAHGTGTIKNDIVETAAIKESLGRRAYEIGVHAVKSMTGHMIAASGAVEAVVAALTIFHKVIPPTINLERPDDQCDLDYVAGAAREFNGDTVLSNSFGFGGQNATLILRRYS